MKATTTLSGSVDSSFLRTPGENILKYVVAVVVLLFMLLLLLRLCYSCLLCYSRPAAEVVGTGACTHNSW